jgi:hypothetical protein
VTGFEPTMSDTLTTRPRRPSYIKDELHNMRGWMWREVELGGSQVGRPGSNPQVEVQNPRGFS